MLQLDSSLRVFISTDFTDMRRSFDSLANLVQEILHQDPLSGHLFVFLNRNRDSVKILHWEKGGYWLYYRRLERGRFKLPLNKSVAGSIELEPSELSLILEGICLDGSKQRIKFIRESLSN